MIIDRETFTELAVHLKLASDAVLTTARHLAVLSNGNIIVSVGNSAMGAGVTCDVQVEAPGATVFSPAGTTGNTTFTFNPSARGVYKFQVRTNNGGGTSGWSPTARVTF